MRFMLPLLAFAGMAWAGGAGAQQRAPQAPPALIECGVHGDVEILCGTRSPEDLEPTPDGKYLIVSQYIMNTRGGIAGAGLMLFDLTRKAFSKLPVSVEPRRDWGDAACPGPVGEMLNPHGISMSRRASGAMQLYVVNHGGRESIEMFEAKPAAGTWSLVWHGCVVSMKDFNDVATLPDGGFVATHPTSLVVQGSGVNVLSGDPTGTVVRWTSGKGESELPGTSSGYPNGLLASADGRYVYFNAWTAREVHRYDLTAKKETGMVKLDFMPDNITWTKRGQLLAAGVKGTRGDCPAGSGEPCIQGFGVAVVNPAKMESKTVFDSQGKGALIGGVSVALQSGGAVYIGSFQGDRLVRINWKE